MCQDAVYAARNLTAGDLAVYHRLAGPAAKRVKPPDLIIHLDGAESLLLERIARRGRRHEACFAADFLSWMRRAYEEVAASAGCPVLAVDVGAVNLMEAGPRRELVGKVREALR